MTTIESLLITGIAMSLSSVVMFLLCPKKQPLMQMSGVWLINVFGSILIFQLAKLVGLGGISNYLICLGTYILFALYYYSITNNWFLTYSLPALGLLIQVFSEIVNYNFILLFSKLDITGTYGTFLGTLRIMGTSILISCLVSLAMGWRLRKIDAANIRLSKWNTAFLTLLIVSALSADYIAPVIITRVLNLDFSGRVLIFDVSLMPFSAIVALLYLFLLSTLKKELIAQKREQYLAMKENMYANMNAYNASLEEIYNEMRAYRHDSQNMICGLAGFIENRDWNGIEKYFNKQLLTTSEEINSGIFKVGRLHHLQIPELKGVIAMKAISTEDKGIDFQTDIAERIENINMDTLDLCRVMGIFLDNALEEAVKSKARKVKCGIIKMENSVQLIVTNSLSRPLNLRKFFTKGYSTKGANRGLGLYNVKMILEQYQGVTLDIQTNNDELCVILSVE